MRGKQLIESLDPLRKIYKCQMKLIPLHRSIKPPDSTAITKLTRIVSNYVNVPQRFKYHGNLSSESVSELPCKTYLEIEDKMSGQAKSTYQITS